MPPSTPVAALWKHDLHFQICLLEPSLRPGPLHEQRHGARLSISQQQFIPLNQRFEWGAAATTGPSAAKCWRRSCTWISSCPHRLPKSTHWLRRCVLPFRFARLLAAALCCRRAPRNGCAWCCCVNCVNVLFVSHARTFRSLHHPVPMSPAPPRPDAHSAAAQLPVVRGTRNAVSCRLLVAVRGPHLCLTSPCC